MRENIAHLICSELFSKQSRGKLFKNKAERDAWLTKEVQSLTQTLQTKQRRAKDLGASVQSLAQQTTQQAEDMVEMQQNVEARKKAIEDGARDYATLKTKRDELTNTRNQVSLLKYILKWLFTNV